MKRGIKGTVCITLITTALWIAPATRAEHAKHYLNEITFEVTNTLATVTNLTVPQRRALTTAAKALKRNTKTVPADLGAFAIAVTPLNSPKAAFDSASGFITVQDPTLDAYSADAHVEVETTLEALGTNTLSKSVSNQLYRATNALARADNTTNAAARARATATAINKLSAVLKQIWRTQTAPVTLVRSSRPHSTNQMSVVDLTRQGMSESETTRYFMTVMYPNDHPEGYFAFTSDKPEELGLWTYERTGAHTGVIHLNVTFAEPPNSVFNHDLLLTFETPTRGTFTGENAAHQELNGTFVVY